MFTFKPDPELDKRKFTIQVLREGNWVTIGIVCIPEGEPAFNQRIDLPTRLVDHTGAVVWNSERV